MTDHPFPESAREMAIVMDLIFGEHPELKTVGDVRAEMTKRLNAMRAEQAAIIEAQNANGMRYENSRSRGHTAAFMVYDEATSLLDDQGDVTSMTLDEAREISRRHYAHEGGDSLVRRDDVWHSRVSRRSLPGLQGIGTHPDDHRIAMANAVLDLEAQIRARGGR